MCNIFTILYNIMFDFSKRLFSVNFVLTLSIYLFVDALSLFLFIYFLYTSNNPLAQYKIRCVLKY